jgi:hypothetical protein
MTESEILYVQQKMDSDVDGFIRRDGILIRLLDTYQMTFSRTEKTSLKNHFR